MVEGTGLYQMAFRTHDETTGLAALAEGLALLRAAWLGLPFDTGTAVARLRSRVGERIDPGPIATLAGGPLIGITGGAETASIAVYAARLLGEESRPTGLLSCRSTAARDALERHAYASAIVESNARSIATQGLPYRRCRIGVVSAFAGIGQLDDLHIDSATRLHAVLRTQVDVVNPEGAAILNAEDPQVAAMARHSDGAVILYGRADNPALRCDGSNGKSVAACADGFLLCDGGHRWTMHKQGDSRMPPGDRLNLCAAIAIAWAMDTSMAGLDHALNSLMQEYCISGGAAV
jgi:cyanophycin synthetase